MAKNQKQPEEEIGPTAEAKYGEGDAAFLIRQGNQKRVFKQHGLDWPPKEDEHPERKKVSPEGGGVSDWNAVPTNQNLIVDEEDDEPKKAKAKVEAKEDNDDKAKWKK